MNEIEILGMIIQYNNTCVTIVDSYKQRSPVLMGYILKRFIEKTGYCSKRSIKSWLKEWKTHNRLYRLGLFRSHTKDCDLDENEKLHRLIAYQILGI